MKFITSFINKFRNHNEKKDEKKLPPGSPSKLLLVSRDITGKTLQFQINGLDGAKWLRAEYSYPAFDDMNFSYKNKVFSVIIDIQDKEGNSYLPEEYVKRQLRAANDYNLIPCKFPVTVPDPNEPELEEIKVKTEGWNLYHTESGEAVFPEDKATDYPIELSDWEMRCIGIKFVTKYLYTKKIKVLSVQYTLEVDPQIWFESKEGKKCWILVRCEKYNKNGIKKPKKMKEIISHCSRYEGFFGGVMIEPKNKNLKKIYRNSDMKISFDKLEQIHSV